MNNYYFLLIILSNVLCAKAQDLQKIKQLDSLLKNDKLETTEQLIATINQDSTNLPNKIKAKYYYLLGRFMDKKDEEAQAFKFYKKASLLYQKTNNEKDLTNVYHSIFYLLNKRKNLKQDAKKYIDQVLKYAIQTKDTNYLIKAYFGKAILNYNNTDYKKALTYYNQIISLAKLKNNVANLAQAYNNKAGIYIYHSKNYDSARFFYKKSKKEYEKINKNKEKFATTLNLGILYTKEKKYQDALKWFLEADSIPLKKYRKNYKRLLYKKMATSYDHLKDYKNALIYLKKYNQYKDSVNLDKQTVAISKIETKYKAVQKEKENIQLKAEKKQQQFILITIIGAFIGSLILGILLYLNLKQKKKTLEKEKELAEKAREMEHQKVNTLIKEQEILAMDAMIEGQEKERLRLAEDLHDNIGSSIATLKMHFDSFKNITNKENPKHSKSLEYTSKILDETYQKVRYLAHTNHVSVMENQGLITSLKLLVQKLSDAKYLKIELNHFGFEKKLNSKLELNIFRIIQEILTNTIKHAKAKNITIDINRFEDILNIIIEDDGIGFDVEKVLNKETSGFGIQNLINRVQRENGKFSIDSQINIGTTIIIEIPINNVI